MPDSVFMVGAGRVGTVLASALYRAGHPVLGQWSRSAGGAARASALTGQPCSHGAFPAEVGHARTVIIAVPDPAVPLVAGALLDAGLLRQVEVVLHCGGVRPAGTALAPLAPTIPVGTLHPLLAVSQHVRDLSCGWFAVEGAPRARERASELVHALGARAFTLDGAAMPLYHAAAAMASNHAVAIWHAALLLLRTAGLSAEVAFPALLGLLHSTLANVEALGLPEALTGPVRRGDAASIAAHLASLEERAPELTALYRSCAGAALRAARALDGNTVDFTDVEVLLR